MRDSELIDRPGKGWTPWKAGSGEAEIDKVWWAARVLHFPKLNVSCWFDGSDLVGIEHWGFRRPQWCMKNKPADWQPRPRDPVEKDRIFKDWINKRRAARGEPPLPYMTQ
jgi:hypothetical protein